MRLIKRTLNFGAKTKVKNPDIIREEKDLRYGTPVFNSTQIKGDFYRIIPSNAKEVAYLRHSRSDYLGSWGKKRLAVLEQEANRRKLTIQPAPKNDRHPM